MKPAGRVALVTGGAKRVGRVIALTLAQSGCHVAITYRTSASEARRTVGEIQRLGVKSIAVKADQRDPAQVKRAVAQVVRRLGAIDILINNASSFERVRFDRVTPGLWADSIATNLSGPWWYAQAVAPEMKRRRAGKIINLLDAAVVSPWVDYLPYITAKGGLTTLTLGLAKALSPEVQVNGIAPGPILFPPGMKRAEKLPAIRKTLLKRAGSPEDLAEAALYLIQADFVTGVVLPVDGGRRLA